MKILNLHVENIKRIKVVDITPKGAMVEITGPNEAGKTTLIDSIKWALTGTRSHQGEPIRQGQKHGSVQVALGDDEPEMIVTRVFDRKEKDGSVTTRLYVKTPSGASYSKGQSRLDKLFGGLTFDPLEFSRMKPRDQFQMLEKFVPGVSWDRTEAQIKGLYEERTAIGRDAKRSRLSAESIEVDPHLPEERISADDVLNDLTTAQAHNVEIAELEHSHRVAEAHAVRLRLAVGGLEDQLLDAQTRFRQAQDDRDALDPVRERIDTGVLSGRLTNINDMNSQFEARDRRNSLMVEANRLDAAYESFSEKIAEVRAGFAAAVEEAEMPVDGITLDDGLVKYEGVPMDQISSGRSIDISADIAIALNPTLRIMLMREGSLLDSKMFARLAAKVEGKGYQWWVERVDESGEQGFYIEEGELVAENEPTRPAAPPPDYAHELPF